MIRVTSFNGSVATFAASAALHGAVLLVPFGRASRSQEAANVVATEISTDSLELPAPPPEPVVTPAPQRAPSWPSHPHPYPVPPDHDGVPHEHPHVPETAAAPAQAAPALTAADDLPRFAMAVGSGTEAYGGVSSEGTGAPGDTDAGGVAVSESDVDGKAHLIPGLPPPYPDDARADGIEGDVKLELVVGPSGAVESARLVRGLGHGLDEAALRAVRQFRFVPATKAGHAVRVRMAWTMQFRLL